MAGHASLRHATQPCLPESKGRAAGELQKLLRSQTTPTSLRQRSELIWLLAGGPSLAEASEWVGIHYTNAHIWTKRFMESGVAGLTDRPKAGRQRTYGSDVDTEIIKAAAAQPKHLGLPSPLGLCPNCANT